MQIHLAVFHVVVAKRRFTIALMKTQEITRKTMELWNRLNFCVAVPPTFVYCPAYCPAYCHL